LGSAVRQHDYDGVPVQSTYFHNSKLPATLTSFYVAGETILEVPHPMFPQMFVHLVVASFSCTTLEENMTTPTETDWAQVYTLMLKRLAKDLHESHNRLKNALELNRIQEFQQRYIPNVRYFQTVGYVPENRLTTASESFSIFLQQTLSQQTTMTTPLRQLCVHLSCAICSHSAVAEQFQEVSLISHNGKLLGIKLHMNVPPIEHADIEFKSCHAFAHNCAQLTAAEILRGVIRPSAAQYPDWPYTSGFVAPKYIVITHRRHTSPHKLRHFEKLVNIVIIRTISDRFVYMERREVVSPIILPSVSVERFRTMVVCNSLTVFIVIEIRGGHFVPISVKSSELLPFCNLFHVHDFHLAQYQSHFVMHGFHYILEMTTRIPENLSLQSCRAFSQSSCIQVLFLSFFTRKPSFSCLQLTIWTHTIRRR